MSLISHARTAARHRGKNPAQLRHELDQAAEGLAGQAQEIALLRRERARLERLLDHAGIELSGAREDLRTAQQDAARLQAAVTAWEARWANEHPVSVPAPCDRWDGPTVRHLADKPTTPRVTTVAGDPSPAHIPHAA